MPDSASPRVPGRPDWRARGLAALLDLATASHRRAVALLVALSLLMFLPGFFQIPPLDRGEARFAQQSRQMVESGEYASIAFQNDLYDERSIGAHWLQAGAVQAARALGLRQASADIWIYRLPSLAGAIAGVLLTYWTALAFVGRRAAFLAGAMIAACVLLGVEARLAKADALLFAATTAAIGALARAYLAPRRKPATTVDWPVAVVFWTALAAGMALNAPLIVLFVGLTALTVSIVDRSAGWLLALRPVVGLIGFLTLVVPGVVFIMGGGGAGDFRELPGVDALSRMFSGQEGRSAPPGFYFVLFWVTFWPGAVLAGLAMPTVWRARREVGAKFLLAWLVPYWIVIELVVTKQPHYALPLYPAVAILIAGVLERGGLSKSRWLSRGTVGWVLLPLAVAAVSIAAFVVLGREPGFVVWPFAAAAAMMGLFAWWLYDVDGAEYAMLRGIVASFLTAVTLYGVTVPSLPAMFPSVAMEQALRDSDCEQPLAAAAGFHEPSLVFLAGTRTLLTDGAGAADFLRQGPCRFAFVEQRYERSFAQRAQAVGLRYAPLLRIDGFNISYGRKVAITVFESGGNW